MWSTTSQEGPDRLTPRTLQASAYDEVSDTLYVHGGFDLNNVLGDFYSYDLRLNVWHSIFGSQKYENRRWSIADTLITDTLEHPIFQTSSNDVSNISDGNSQSPSKKHKKIKFSKVNSTTVSMKMLSGDDFALDREIDGRTYGAFNSIENTVLRKRRSPMMPENLLEKERKSTPISHPRFKSLDLRAIKC